MVRPTTERRDEKGKGEGEGGSVRLMCLLSQPGSSASNYDSVKTSAQLAGDLPRPEFQDISLKLSTFLCLKYLPKDFFVP